MKSNQIEQKLSSREVAEMMEVRHDSLLRKIDGINEDLAAHKIVVSKYWVETSSPDNSGKLSREFLITKRGCEFLAHKTTGTKGNLFTDKYMERFEQMKSYIEEGGVKPKEIDDSVKAKEVEARYNNSLVRKANLLLKIAKDNPLVTDEYKKVLQAKATEIVAGQAILPLPVAERKTYSATEIGEKLGISANKVGVLANKHNLKCDTYGKLFHDKSRYSNKEVESFRYYEEVIPVLESFL